MSSPGRALHVVDPNYGTYTIELLAQLQAVIVEVRAELAGTDRADLVDVVLARHGYRIADPR